MPDTSERLHIRSMETPRRRPVLAAVAVAASIAAHGVAMAAVSGFWSDDTSTTARPIEVVMVALTRPSRLPVPSSTMGAPVPPAAIKSVAAEHPPRPDAVAPPESVDTRISVQQAAIERWAEPTAMEMPKVASAPIVTRPVKTAPLVTVSPQKAAVARPNENAEPAPGISRPPRPVGRPAATDLAPSDKKRASLAATGTPPTSASTVSDLASLDGRSDARPALAEAGRPAAFDLGSAGNPAPDYPIRARQRGWEGRVVLRVAVDDRGQPVAIDIATSSGHRVLDDAAHRTVARWVFQPATRGGQQVAGEAIVPVVFRLN